MIDIVTNQALLSRRKSIKCNLEYFESIINLLSQSQKNILTTTLEISLEKIQQYPYNHVCEIASLLISADENVKKKELEFAKRIFPDLSYLNNVDDFVHYYKIMKRNLEFTDIRDWAIKLSVRQSYFFETLIDCISDNEEAYHHFKHFLLYYRDDIFYVAKNIIECDEDIDDDELYGFTALVMEFDTMLFKNNIVDVMPNQTESLRDQIDNIDDTIQNEDDLHELNSESVISNKNENLEIYLSELNKLIGLNKVKQEVMSLVNLIKIRNMRQQNGLSNVPMSLHLVFLGNPGTGKTTVACLLAKIYNSIGLLSSGHLVETDRSGLVAGYVGQTAIKTQEIIQQAKGGILFIDEAYSLFNSERGNDFGDEAISTLIKGMEDNRDDLIVIMAGYPELME